MTGLPLMFPGAGGNHTAGSADFAMAYKALRAKLNKLNYYQPLSEEPPACMGRLPGFCEMHGFARALGSFGGSAWCAVALLGE